MISGRTSIRHPHLDALETVVEKQNFKFSSVKIYLPGQLYQSTVRGEMDTDRKAIQKRGAPSKFQFNTRVERA